MYYSQEKIRFWQVEIGVTAGLVLQLKFNDLRLTKKLINP